ncbi:MAG: hypothetical protein AAF962_14620 [Actinomycetota bacterium]
MPSINGEGEKLRFPGTPVDAISGVLRDDVTLDDFVEDALAAGIEDTQIFVLVGEEGAAVLDRIGNPISRLFAPSLEWPAEQLRNGKTLVTVVELSEPVQDQAATSLAEAGLRVSLRFGKWTYS